MNIILLNIFTFFICKSFVYTEYTLSLLQVFYGFDDIVTLYFYVSCRAYSLKKHLHIKCAVCIARNTWFS